MEYEYPIRRRIRAQLDRFNESIYVRRLIRERSIRQTRLLAEGAIELADLAEEYGSEINNVLRKRDVLF